MWVVLQPCLKNLLALRGSLSAAFVGLVFVNSCAMLAPQFEGSQSGHSQPDEVSTTRVSGWVKESTRCCQHHPRQGWPKGHPDEVSTTRVSGWVKESTRCC